MRDGTTTATRSAAAPFEIDASTLENGLVRCQCERNGKPCNSLLGKLTPDSAQFYCDKCQIEVVVKGAPVLGIITDNGRHISTLQNPDKMSLLAMLIHSDNAATTMRARYADMLMTMPAA